MDELIQNLFQKPGYISKEYEKKVKKFIASFNEAIKIAKKHHFKIFKMIPSFVDLFFMLKESRTLSDKTNYVINTEKWYDCAIKALYHNYRKSKRTEDLFTLGYVCLKKIQWFYRIEWQKLLSKRRNVVKEVNPLSKIAVKAFHATESLIKTRNEINEISFWKNLAYFFNRDITRLDAEFIEISLSKKIKSKLEYKVPYNALDKNRLKTYHSNHEFIVAITAASKTLIKKNYLKGIRLLNLAVNYNPYDCTTHFDLAELYMGIGKTKETTNHLCICAKYYPYIAQLWYYFALLATKQFQFKSALIYLKRASSKKNIDFEDTYKQFLSQRVKILRNDIYGMYLLQKRIKILKGDFYDYLIKQAKPTNFDLQRMSRMVANIITKKLKSPEPQLPPEISKSDIMIEGKKMEILTHEREIEIPEIVFVPEHVRIYRLHNPILQPILERSRERYFLEYLVLKGKIHYLHCFIIFKERGINFNPKEFMNDPISIFKKIKANLSTCLRPFRTTKNEDILHFRIDGPDEGYFYLKLDANKQFKSNIIEARDSYRDALSLFNESKFHKSIEKLHGKNSAIKKYLNYLDAYKLLAKCYIGVGLQDIEKEKIQEVRRFLERRFSWFQQGVRAINEYLSTVNKTILGNEYDIFNEIKKERDELSDILSQLKLISVSKSEEDIKWDLFNKIQGSIARYSADQNYDATVIKLLDLKEKDSEIMLELVSQQVNKEIERLEWMSIEGQTDEEIREKRAMKVSGIKISCIRSLIEVLEKQKYKRTDFDSWQDCVNHIRCHIKRLRNPPEPSKKENRRIRKYVREYFKIIKREGLKGQSFKDQKPILKKYGFGEKRLQDILQYLNSPKEVSYDDEKSQGRKIPS